MLKPFLRLTLHQHGGGRKVSYSVDHTLENTIFYHPGISSQELTWSDLTGTQVTLWALRPVLSMEASETLPPSYSSSGKNKNIFKADLDHDSAVSNSRLDDQL